MVNISGILVPLIRKEENVSKLTETGIKVWPADIDNITYHFESTDLNMVKYGAMENTTVLYGNMTRDGPEEEPLGFFMANIRLLKAIVLGVVVLILLLSTCKFVLKAFSKYNNDDGERKY